MFKRLFARCWPALAVVGGAWLLFSRLGSPEPTHQLSAGPLVLERVQSLGELRTARYHYQNVFEYRTHRRAADWAKTVGLSGLVQAATKNKALATLHGSVDAGVDLQQARILSQTPLVLELPAPQIYEPIVDIDVHRTWVGAFWRDDNIGVKALREMKGRLKSAATSQGILQEARRGAETRVLELLDLLGVEAEVRFASPDKKTS
ncbi:MAG TPA: DUF4230 domain-containing protein [Fimbriimonadaceae bacterium]|nr:DUF4230 domain-containing protein [Fimbriimonadaceae bacterium]